MKTLQSLSHGRNALKSPAKVISHSSTKTTDETDKTDINKVKTPHIDLFNIRELKSTNDSENLLKNFSQMMKQIIESKNTHFLNGNINLIEYILSKYTNIPNEKIGDIERISLIINFEQNLLNQFGQYLPKLKELILNYSIIPSFADVGSSFSNLKEIYITNTGLKDLNGILKNNTRNNMLSKLRSVRCI